MVVYQSGIFNCLITIVMKFISEHSWFPVLQQSSALKNTVIQTRGYSSKISSDFFILLRISMNNNNKITDCLFNIFSGPELIKIKVSEGLHAVYSHTFVASLETPGS